MKLVLQVVVPFIETFAKSLKYDVRSFAQAAVESQAPVDLGSRCTVL